jgi:DNA polymerase elongation subunit (family B)
MGHEVNIGDTDSLFFSAGTGGDAPAEDLEGLGAGIATTINARLADYAREGFGVVSRMGLESKAIYRRFFLPPMREGIDKDEETEARGRAEGYAGLPIVVGPDGSGVELPLDAKGIEAARHERTPLAQELQRGFLEPRRP